MLGSGTLNRGCLLELGAVVDGDRWLEPGDVVAIAAPGLGELDDADRLTRTAFVTGRSNSVESTTWVCVRRMPGRVAQPLERLLEVLGVARVQVQDRARLAGDRVGGRRPRGGARRRRGSPPPDIRPSQKSETTACVVQPSASWSSVAE